MKWYREAAEQGYRAAEFNLGLMYARGSGVPQDYPEAVKWFSSAAEQGHPAAQLNLGIAYARGQGAVQDVVVALMWLSVASLGGNADASHLSEELATVMTPDQIAEAKKRAQEWLEQHHQD